MFYALHPNYDIYRLDRFRRDFLANAIGEVVTRWASLEIVAFELYMAATDEDKQSIVMKFRKQKNFQSVLKLVDRVMSDALEGKPETAFWKSLVKYVSDLSRERNFVAHGIISGSSVLGPNSPPSLKCEFYVCPKIICGNGFMFHGDFTTAMTMLNGEEVMELVGDIQYTIELMVKFKSELFGVSPLQPKFHRDVVRRRPPREQRLEGIRTTPR